MPTPLLSPAVLFAFSMLATPWAGAPFTPDPLPAPASPPPIAAAPPAPPTSRPSPPPDPASRGRPASARWSWPVAPAPRVLQAFEAPAQRWSRGHRGVDLTAPPRAPVRAPADGTIAYVGVIAGRPVVSIDHADGLRTSLEPVSAALPVGTAVTKGQLIGTLAAAAGGGTHCAALSCVHWGVRRGDAYLDPLALLRRAAPVLLPLDGALSARAGPATARDGTPTATSSAAS